MTEGKIFMIVDDDIDDCYFFSEAVRNINPSNECREAEDGDFALEQLCKVDPLPDYIFLDLNMPRMDGKQCLEKLKRNERLKNIPVVIYSTSSSEQEIADLLSGGAAHYINKPTNISKLPGEIIKAVEIVEQGIYLA